ncbi:Stf0 family sulfotransferase [Alteraurantiacibacter aquimixticola]|nr:Stf0 family sulfotransferase [Alteraurantiacibacter aquimixticola]
MTGTGQDIPGYLVCTHPRSGSSYFCQLLESTGKLGKPLEYFTHGHMRRRFADPADPASLQAQMHHFEQVAASSNGLRAAKLFWFDMPGLAKSRLLDRFAGYRAVHLERADKLGQAISISRALRTGQIRSDMGAADSSASYEYDDIRRRLETLLTADASWKAFFKKQRMRPLHILYEDVTANPQAAVDRVARLVGLESAPIDKDGVTLRMQRDTLNSEWRERFLAEVSQRNPGLAEGLKGATAA